MTAQELEKLKEDYFEIKKIVGDPVAAAILTASRNTSYDAKEITKELSRLQANLSEMNYCTPYPIPGRPMYTYP